MSRHWYSNQSEFVLFERSNATQTQVEYARELLENSGEVPLDDYNGHIGAFTMLVDHLKSVAADPPERIELKRRFRTIARRPSFDIRDPISSRSGRRHWAWIDPRTIARGRILGKPFPRSQYSEPWMIQLTQQILEECESPEMYLEHFNDPRYGYVIVVTSIPGPFGPIRPIGTNGNHRSMAFEALGCPVVLAEVSNEGPPYRITYKENVDAWQITRDYLKWLEDQGAIRLSSRSVVRRGQFLDIRIAEATTPWLASSPREALAALDAYEQFWGHKLESVGQLQMSELRRRWKSAARTKVRSSIFAKTVSAATLIRPADNLTNFLSSEEVKPRSLPIRRT